MLDTKLYQNFRKRLISLPNKLRRFFLADCGVIGGRRSMVSSQVGSFGTSGVGIFCVIVNMLFVLAELIASLLVGSVSERSNENSA